MAQKICPQCSQGMGPRSKSCPKCGYEYPHLQNGSSKNDDDDDNSDGSEVKTRVERKSCFNCGLVIESIKSNVDSYGKVIYHYRYDNYCGTNCMLIALEVKDNLILEILNKAKDLNNEDLNSFIEDKRKIGIYEDVIQNIELNALTESENAEYYKTHSKPSSNRNIVPYSLTTARDNALMRGDFTLVRIINEKLGEPSDNSNLDKNSSSIEEREKAGIRIPPKIGSYVHKEPEEAINPFKALLLGIKSPVIENEDENDEEEEEEEVVKEEEVPASPKPLSIAEIFAKSSPKPIVPTTPFKFVTPVTPVVPVVPVVPVISNPISSSYDAVSKPTQGQKKCGAKDRARGLMVGCGKINGVRTRQCSCGYTFP